MTYMYVCPYGVCEMECEGVVHIHNVDVSRYNKLAVLQVQISRHLRIL